MTTPYIVPIRAFTDNYIWVIRDHCHAAVVDPGDASPVLDYLRHEKLKLIAILNTHHHKDHSGGNAALLQEFTVPVYGPEKESIPTLTHRLREYTEKEKEEGNVYLSEFSLSLKVLDIPGPYCRAYCLLWRKPAVLWRHVVRLRLWTIIRGHRTANGRFPGKNWLIYPKTH